MQAHAQVPRVDGQVADQARGASGGQVDSGRLGLTEEGRRITAVGGAISATRGGGTRAIRRSVVDPLSRGGPAYQELAAHPQVGAEGAAVIQGQPQELAATHHRGDAPASELLREGLGAAVLTTQRPGVHDLHAGDGAPDQVAGQARAHGLYLGQLRHGRPGRPGGR